MPEQLSLLEPPPPTRWARVLSERDAALARVRAHAEAARKRFAEDAAVVIEVYLREHGPTTAEQLVDVCLAEGCRPHDQRAFGPVFLALSKAKRIRKVGTAPRAKGHGTSGGNIWEAA